MFINVYYAVYILNHRLLQSYLICNFTALGLLIIIMHTIFNTYNEHDQLPVINIHHYGHIITLHFQCSTCILLSRSSSFVWHPEGCVCEDV